MKKVLFKAKGDSSALRRDGLWTFKDFKSTSLQAESTATSLSESRKNIPLGVSSQRKSCARNWHINKHLLILRQLGCGCIEHSLLAALRLKLHSKIATDRHSSFFSTAIFLTFGAVRFLPSLWNSQKTQFVVEVGILQNLGKLRWTLSGPTTNLAMKETYEMLHANFEAY